jgi:hypothetical protein
MSQSLTDILEEYKNKSIELLEEGYCLEDEEYNKIEQEYIAQAKIKIEELYAERDALTAAYMLGFENGKDEMKKVFGEWVQKRIDYIKKYKLGSDYTNGFSGIESGECCDKCKPPKDEKNPLRKLCGCKDPFQINCKCHIPYRKVATNSELNMLEELKQEIRNRVPGQNE